MSQLEPYLSDARVGRVAETLFDEFPKLSDYGTDLVTARIEPPWHGQLPDDTVGWTQHAVVQFIASSPHPRPLQRKHGYRHTTLAAAWERAFEDSVKEQEHYVNGQPSPEERIFRMVVIRHIQEMDKLKSIMN